MSRRGVMMDLISSDESTIDTSVSTSDDTTSVSTSNATEDTSTTDDLTSASSSDDGVIHRKYVRRRGTYWVAPEPYPKKYRKRQVTNDPPPVIKPPPRVNVYDRIKGRQSVRFTDHARGDSCADHQREVIDLLDSDSSDVSASSSASSDDFVMYDEDGDVITGRIVETPDPSAEELSDESSDASSD